MLAAHGEGRYTIEIIEDRVRAESARAMAMQRIAQLDQQIAQLGQQINAAQGQVDQAAAHQDAAILLYKQQMQDTGSSSVDLAAVAFAVQEAAAKRDSLRIQQQHARTSRLALQSRIQRIDALPPLRQVEAWCADYTEDLAGDVATAEVPGEAQQVIIKPGFHDAAAWSPSTDGAIQPALSGTPASVFYNLALMPGWQKWRPTFRIATISNIDNDLCDISLVPAASSQQGLNVNAKSVYSGVPIMYMDCNGDAFEDGDRVLVAFSGNTGQPLVVGFEKEPKECYRLDGAVMLMFSAYATDVLGLLQSLQHWLAAYADENFEEGVVPDNTFQLAIGFYGRGDQSTFYAWFFDYKSFLNIDTFEELKSIASAYFTSWGEANPLLIADMKDRVLDFQRPYSDAVYFFSSMNSSKGDRRVMFHMRPDKTNTTPEKYLEVTTELRAAADIRTVTLPSPSGQNWDEANYVMSDLTTVEASIGPEQYDAFSAVFERVLVEKKILTPSP